MRTRLLVFAPVCLASSVLIAATPDTGRYRGIPRPGAVAQPVAAGSIGRPEDFGPAGDTVSTFIPEAFRPSSSNTTFTAALGSMWVTPPPVAPTAPSGVSGPSFTANLQIPEGAVVDYVVLNVCNNNPTPAPLLFGAGHDIMDFADVSTSVTNGCDRVSSPLIGYQNGANANMSFYVFIDWGGGPTDGSVAWRDAQVWWHRTVSPAPVTPTFGDVPTSDPGFQYIEALVESGITAGCGSGNYCPDATLTRRQMAVFLSKALGLYWSNIN
ncbi:MAG TPA: S-layer homology domain-containing protein [Thermoanaerobaculia bacterium]|jgi:hypothetical protein|nr:S-layer homology domain-containing protein [Thermoanaerobaculia bacterium]